MKSTAVISVNDIIGYKTFQTVTSICASQTDNCEYSCNKVHVSISSTLTIMVLYCSNLTDHKTLVISGSPTWNFGNWLFLARGVRCGAGRCIVFTLFSVERYHLPSHIFPFAWNATHVTVIAVGQSFIHFILLFSSIDPYSMGSSPKTGYRIRQEIA
jgi:hypothetical protein